MDLKSRAPNEMPLHDQWYNLLIPSQVIPRQLCDNAGFDATNILNKLRQKHAQVELFISLINKLAV